MQTLIKLEELAKLILAFTGSVYMGFSWWLFPALLLLPDGSMLAYLAGHRAGAWFYNLFHHQAVAIVIGLTGMILQNQELQLAGLVLFGHSAMDRALGYGLKFPDHFQHTHLGWIGKARKGEAPSLTGKA